MAANDTGDLSTTMMIIIIALGCVVGFTIAILIAMLAIPKAFPCIKTDSSLIRQEVDVDRQYVGEEAVLLNSEQRV